MDCDAPDRGSWLWLAVCLEVGTGPERGAFLLRGPGIGQGAVPGA